ncbi:MAG: serine/threonine-protein kinase [Solirubrobacteraceae bacterium]|nr:serine/threonine-protein kinase [Solirubrobacteraceae bacterium]
MAMPFPEVLTAGTIVDGRFEITGPLGHGGTATVYSARQLSVEGRPVALKVMHSYLTGDPDFVRSFKREAGLSGHLDHPNIVYVHESGEHDGHLYIAMQKVSGTTLRQNLQGGRRSLDAAAVLAILEYVADALDYAHQEGVTHRDVKPENILLDHRGRVYLADFGIARAASTATMTRRQMATENYAAPEQLKRVKGEKLTGAVDIYALAIVAYEALTDAPGPYDAQDQSIVFAHLEQQPLPLLPAGPGADALHAALSRGLAKAPADRPATAREFVEDLRQALAVDPAAGERVPAFSQDNPGGDEDLDWNDPDPHVGLTIALPGATELPSEPATQVTGELPAFAWPEAPTVTALVDEPLPAAVTAPVPAPAPAPAAPVDEARPVRRRRSPTLPALPTWWPLPLAVLTIAAPLVALRSRPEPPPGPSALRAGPVSFTAATGTRPVANPQPIAAAALKGAPAGGSTTAIGTPGDGVAVRSLTSGTAAIAPADATSAETLRIAGGTARRYRVGASTITVAQTPETIVWAGCSRPSSAVCSQALGSLTAGDETLQADPIPNVAETITAALAQARERRQRPMPTTDRARRQERAVAIATAYRRGAQRLDSFVDERPRDRDVRDLATAVRAAADSYTRIAGAADTKSTTSDRRGRAALASADARIARAGKKLAARGYKVTP